MITTYSIVRLDWKKSLAGHDVGITQSLHALTWRRIVLDEGILSVIAGYLSQD